MLSQKLRSLSATLLVRPVLAIDVANRLAELADSVSHLEHSPIPDHLTAPIPVASLTNSRSDKRLR